MPTDLNDLSPARRNTVRVLAGIGLVTFCFLLIFVATDALGRAGDQLELEPPGSREAQIGADHPGEVVHIAGALAAATIGGTGLIALLVRPQRAGSATQAGASTLAMLLAVAIIGDPDNHGGHGLLVDPAFLILALPPLAAALTAAPWRVWRREPHQRRLLVLAALVLPIVVYGIDQGLLQRNT
jgi:hypothetical protein